MLTLILIVAGVTTQHPVTGASLEAGNTAAYIEAGILQICRANWATFEYDGAHPNSVTVTADTCKPDSLFHSRFE